MTISTAILGASGYTGAELLRYLENHPIFQVVVATADSAAGRKVGDLYPHLHLLGNTLLTEAPAIEELDGIDIIFCALPHGQAMDILPKLQSKLIIDLGGDFRLKSKNLYQQWYGKSHVAGSELEKWVYGLSECFAPQIRTAQRIANPGCYATAVELGFAPLIREGLIQGTLVADALSGLSGAGKSPKPELHFSHASEDIRAYKIGAHQHTPEIEQTLSAIAGKDVMVSLTTHLVPISRGIHATLSADVVPGTISSRVIDAFKSTYANAPFVRVVDTPPGTKEVRGSNYVHVHPAVDTRTGRVIVTVALDNLGKGAAGQAIQNANLALGIPEVTGLTMAGVYP